MVREQPRRSPLGKETFVPLTLGKPMQHSLLSYLIAAWTPAPGLGPGRGGRILVVPAWLILLHARPSSGPTIVEGRANALNTAVVELCGVCDKADCLLQRRAAAVEFDPPACLSSQMAPKMLWHGVVAEVAQGVGSRCREWRSSDLALRGASDGSATAQT